MKPNTPPSKTRPNESEIGRYFKRRRFLALGAGMGATLLAGCSTETDLSEGNAGRSPLSDSDGSTAASGTFRLLISDQPAAIGDFDELSVSFDRCRIFRANSGEDEDATSSEGNESAEVAGNETEIDSSDGNGTDNETTIESSDGNESTSESVANTTSNNSTAPANSTQSTNGTDDEPEQAAASDGDQRGFSVIDLGGATVDLTNVVGDKAMGVFDGELREGRYTKIELYVMSVEGIVDGEPVEVKVPSNKMQLVKPFEVVYGETLSYVFDINVVKKGKTGEYNLLPVFSESGVAGKDVEVNEVGKPDSEAGSGSETEEGETEEEETEEEETEESENEDGSDNGGEEGPPTEAGGSA